MPSYKCQSLDFLQGKPATNVGGHLTIQDFHLNTNWLYYLKNKWIFKLKTGSTFNRLREWMVKSDHICESFLPEQGKSSTIHWSLLPNFVEWFFWQITLCRSHIGVFSSGISIILWYANVHYHVFRSFRVICKKPIHNIRKQTVTHFTLHLGLGLTIFWEVYPYEGYFQWEVIFWEYSYSYTTVFSLIFR